MPSVLHILPHRGGGSETLIDILEGGEGWTHERIAISATRAPGRAVASVAARWPRVAAAARRHDVVHAHGDVVAMLSLPLLVPRPSLYGPEGLHFLRRARGARALLARALIARVLSAASVTVCCSKAECDELEPLAASGVSRMRVVYNGVPVPELPSDADRRDARAALRIPEDAVTALYLGQLEERKDPLTAVAAAEAVARSEPFVLLVAGDGPLRDQVEARAADGVRMLGFRSDPERLLAAADVFVMPSRREGLSMAVIEAMALGLAVVVSDGPGNPEAVEDTGVVFPVGDTEALARELRKLCRDPERRRRLGAAARERAASELSADNLIAGMTAAYEDALRAPGRAGAARPA